MKCNQCQKDILPGMEECPWCGALLISLTGEDHIGNYYIDPITREKMYE